MSIREFTKSGTFVLVLLGAAVIGVPFGIEQIGETTGWFGFPVSKTIRGWFAPAAKPVATVAKPVDWERYRKALAEFTEWADGRSVAVISCPEYDPAVFTIPEEKKSDRQIWAVPVTSCTAAGAANRSRGYAFISGFDHPFDEGSVIDPTKDRCGFEIVSVGERSVWFRAVFETEGYVPMGIVRFPDFTRVDGQALVRGNRKYFARDAFPLVTGGWLMIDSFLPPDGTVFKIIDANHREIATILCVIIGKKGGR